MQTGKSFAKLFAFVLAVGAIAAIATIWNATRVKAFNLRPGAHDYMATDDGGDDRDTVIIKWPGPGLRDLQSAVDAAPDGARVQIAEGDYAIAEPIFLRGKRLMITGAGSGRKGEGRVTRLLGPPPHPVVGDRGELVLLADAVLGLFNVVGAGQAEFSRLEISGFDAGIVGKNDAEGNSAPVTVEDVVIARTGRGILSLSTSDVTVDKCTIMNTLWHGISLAPQFSGLPRESLAAVHDTEIIASSDGAGVYFADKVGNFVGTNVLLNQGGGIVGFRSHPGTQIIDCNIVSNRKAGIILERSQGTPLIKNTFVVGTLALKNGAFGDGIVVVLSEQNPIGTDIEGNFILGSARAGVSNFGGVASLGDNQILCSAAFDLAGDTVGGVDEKFHDLGGNVCGCPNPQGPCVNIVDAQLEPPDPVGGLQ